MNNKLNRKEEIEIGKHLNAIAEIFLNKKNRGEKGLIMMGKWTLNIPDGPVFRYNMQIDDDDLNETPSFEISKDGLPF